jgi:hypothetical protein
MGVEKGFVDRRLIVEGTVSRQNTVGKKSVVQKIGFQTKRKKEGEVEQYVKGG